MAGRLVCLRMSATLWLPCTQSSSLISRPQVGDFLARCLAVCHSRSRRFDAGPHLFCSYTDDAAERPRSGPFIKQKCAAHFLEHGRDITRGLVAERRVGQRFFQATRYAINRQGVHLTEAKRCGEQAGHLSPTLQSSLSVLRAHSDRGGSGPPLCRNINGANDAAPNHRPTHSRHSLAASRSRKCH